MVDQARDARPPEGDQGSRWTPYRLSLDATAQVIADNFGPGTYRLDALDALGNVIDYVTTVEVTDDELEGNDHEDESSAMHAGDSSDLRFALQTITQMARAQSDAMRAVAEAQADWVKGLASAQALPRNATYVARPRSSPPQSGKTATTMTAIHLPHRCPTRHPRRIGWSACRQQMSSCAISHPRSAWWCRCSRSDSAESRRHRPRLRMVHHQPLVQRRRVYPSRPPRRHGQAFHATR